MERPSAKTMLIPFSERPYRPCVGIMLINDHGLVFVAQRIDQVVEAWQMPQGGVEQDETPRQAALRELEEEIGTNRAEIIAETEDWIPYDLPRELADKVWRGRFRGQTQKWFAMRFLGTDGDINLATAEPEFDAWKWTPWRPWWMWRWTSSGTTTPRWWTHFNT